MLDMDLVVIAGTTIVLSAMGMVYSLIRRRLDRGRSSGGDLRMLAERLDRIEQGVEAVAVEVERLGEAQRYTTRLLGERPAERLR